jgi:2,4-dienoyl-CoA reductase-like NADH-dependent reductase (Old Yellow Enzyme family)
MNTGGIRMSKLFSPALIGNMELKNHFVRSATWEGLAEPDGSVTEPLLEVYRNLAQGEVGLILTSYANVSEIGKASEGMIGVYSDFLIPSLKRLADAVHEQKGKVAIQIAHGGSQRMFNSNLPLEAPSAVKERFTGNMPGEMTIEDINRVIMEFAEAAARVKEAGFDGVQIHSAHGYLLSQFLSPYSNRRTDLYGGTREKRARIIFEIYEEARTKLGTHYPIMIKINVSDFVDRGLSPDESLWVCKRLSEMGIDAIELSGGIPAAGDLMPIRKGINKPEKEAYFRDLAENITPHLKCPVIIVGGLRSLEVMEELYEKGIAQFFSLSRPLISEPDLIRRWHQGDRQGARCISCNKCLIAAKEEKKFYCVHFSKKTGNISA